jgi:membrane protein YqaA with SNARE-associated domain
LVAQPALRRDSELRRRVASFASTRSALLLAATWAVAEAVSWPVVPEALLVALVLAAPAMWWRLSLAAVVGAAIGGVITLSLVGGGVRPPLPLVTDDMRAVVAQDVAASGERAVYRQPFSGIPYKVYATAAGERSLDAATFGVHTAVARGSRFLLVTAATALVAWSLRRWRHYYPAALSIALAGYLVGLSLVVAGWSS